MLSPAAKLATYAIRAYQCTLAFWLGGACRFVPSCSEYALLAIRRYGAARGVVLAARRLARCHPFAPGGVDYP